MSKTKAPEVKEQEWKPINLRHPYCTMVCQMRGKGELEIDGVQITVDIPQQLNLVRELSWKQIMKAKFAPKGRHENQKDQENREN